MVAGLRDMVLGTDPAEIGLSPSSERPDVWGGLLEMGRPGGEWASLVVVGDGSVSLYFSTGGGTIGAGQHPAVRAAGFRWLSMLQDGLALLPVTEPPGLPGPDRVVIRALTFGGQRSLEAPEDDLGYERLPASMLFHGAHEVITEIRETQERRDR
jgi:hypothetical protein